MRASKQRLEDKEETIKNIRSRSGSSLGGISDLELALENERQSSRRLQAEVTDVSRYREELEVVLVEEKSMRETEREELEDERQRR